MKIELNDLGFSYKSRQVFQHVNYIIDKPNLFFLVGPNGAGKSTLLKCINGINMPTEGQVLVDDVDVQTMNIRERARIFGYVPQFSTINQCLNVLETVVSGRMAQMNSRASQKDIQAAEEILEELDLTSFALRPLHQLSGGERQRIMVARALAQEPKIILMDEPTSNLDLRYQLETMELMEKTSRKKGIGIIAVIHDLNAVLRYADEVILLDKGSICSSGKPQDVINHEHVASSFYVEAAFTESEGVPYMIPLHSLGC